MPGLELKVFYYSDRGLVDKKNDYQEIVHAWDLPLLEGYASELLPNRVNEENWKMPVFQPFINPDISYRLRDGKFDAVMIHSYLYPSDWLAFWRARRTNIAVLFYGEMYPRSLGGWPRKIVRTLLHKPMLSGTDACLAIGSVARQVFQENYHIPSEQIFLRHML